MERQVNIHIVFLFVFLLALSIGSTIGSSIRSVGAHSLASYGSSQLWQWFFSNAQWYLLEQVSITGRGKYAIILRNILH